MTRHGVGRLGHKYLEAATWIVHYQTSALQSHRHRDLSKTSGKCWSSRKKRRSQLEETIPLGNTTNLSWEITRTDEQVITVESI